MVADAMSSSDRRRGSRHAKPIAAADLISELDQELQRVARQKPAGSLHHRAEAQLVVESGNYAGTRVVLSDLVSSIGRSSKCTLSLKGTEGVSRRHCQIQRVGDDHVLTDLDSRNGVLVNGERKFRHVLKDGDTIGVCDENIRFCVVGSRDVEDLSDARTQMLPSRAAYTDAVPEIRAHERKVVRPNAPRMQVEAPRPMPTASLVLPAPFAALDAAPAPAEPPRKKRRPKRIPPRQEGPIGTAAFADEAPSPLWMVALLLLAVGVASLVAALWFWPEAVADAALRVDPRLRLQVVAISDALHSRGDAAAPEPSTSSPPTPVVAPPSPASVVAAEPAAQPVAEAARAAVPASAPPLKAVPAAADGIVTVKAGMRGKLLRLLVAEGVHVDAGAAVAVIELDNAPSKKRTALLEERAAFVGAASKGDVRAQAELDTIDAELVRLRKSASRAVLVQQTGTVVSVTSATGSDVTEDTVVVTVRTGP